MPVRTICCVSDTHCLHENIEIPQCDILIHAGDACGSGTIREFTKFASWFNRQTQAKHRVYVPGNHDRVAETDSFMCQTLIEEVPGSYFLFDRLVDLEGLRIYGTPWTPAFCDWAFQGDDFGGIRPRYRDLSRTFGMIPECDILVCHGPFYKTADLCEPGSFSAGEHVGSRTMLRVLTEMKKRPSHFVCGHIHDCYGFHQTDLGITVVNAAIAYDYVNCNKPLVFNL